jgi:hypothetical protein
MITVPLNKTRDTLMPTTTVKLTNWRAYQKLAHNYQYEVPELTFTVHYHKDRLY